MIIQQLLQIASVNTNNPVFPDLNIARLTLVTNIL